MAETRYVALGKDKFLYAGRDRSTKVRQVLWGDHLQCERRVSGWWEVNWAPRDPSAQQMLWIPHADTTDERPLEIVFVDVGQGDGAVLITPETDQRERVMVIDAGQGTNMYDFVDGRFGSYDDRQFHAAVITHPDKDHYYGFGRIFDDHSIGFDHVYHNGLIERPVAGEWPKVLGHTLDPDNGERYVTSLAVDETPVRAAFGDERAIGDFDFPNVMHKALTNASVTGYEMLGRDASAVEPVWLPDFGPDDGRGYTIEILGPVVETKNGEPRLRKLGKYGETKNGHSVLLKLTIGRFKVLFGGDLNDRAEKFLLSHYTGLDEYPKKGSQMFEDMIADASKTFRCDVMKACHHGSEKVTDAFLRAVNAAALFISSGEDGHIHPRPDMLGRFGTFGRGEKPLILSTELQRSTREREDKETVERLMRKARRAAESATPDAALGQELAEEIERLGRTNVAVWGSIYLKTDGERLIAAFKTETGSAKKKWFYFEYEWNDDGLLALVD